MIYYGVFVTINRNDKEVLFAVSDDAIDLMLGISRIEIQRVFQLRVVHLEEKEFQTYYSRLQEKSMDRDMGICP